MWNSAIFVAHRILFSTLPDATFRRTRFRKWPNISSSIERRRPCTFRARACKRGAPCLTRIDHRDKQGSLSIHRLASLANFFQWPHLTAAPPNLQPCGTLPNFPVNTRLPRKSCALGYTHMPQLPRHTHPLLLVLRELLSKEMHNRPPLVRFHLGG